MDEELSTEGIPLVVDLDGTLIDTDLLFEGIKLLLKKNIFNLLLCFLWLTKGRVFLKRKVNEYAPVQPYGLPFNIQIIEFLKQEAAKGRKIILATASLKSIAQEIAQFQPLFNEVLGSENDINLKGKNKLNLLIEKFGKHNFDYIGNSNSDLIIFASSRYSYLVNPKSALEKKARKISNLKFVWHDIKSI